MSLSDQENEALGFTVIGCGCGSFLAGFIAASCMAAFIWAVMT